MKHFRTWGILVLVGLMVMTVLTSKNVTQASSSVTSWRVDETKLLNGVSGIHTIQIDAARAEVNVRESRDSKFHVRLCGLMYGPYRVTPSLRLSASKGVVEIYVNVPKQANAFIQSKNSLVLDVLIPKGRYSSGIFHIQEADIVLENVAFTSTMDATDDAGDISILGSTSQSVIASSDTGDIQISPRTLPSFVFARVGIGNVLLRTKVVPRGVQIHAKSDLGSVQVQLPGLANIEDSQAINRSFGIGGGVRFELYTGNGDIVVKK
jgi:hypothetical protein